MVSSLYLEGTFLVGIDGELVAPPLIPEIVARHASWSRDLTTNGKFLVLDEIAVPNKMDLGVQKAFVKDPLEQLVMAPSRFIQQGSGMLYFVNSIPGLPADQSCCRSELAGVLHP